MHCGKSSRAPIGVSKALWVWVKLHWSITGLDMSVFPMIADKLQRLAIKRDGPRPGVRLSIPPRAGAEAVHALTFNPEHLMGADQ
jgi:hypothetical protein